MASIETFAEFKANVKARGCTVLLKEIDTYDCGHDLPVLYAEANGTLIGTWSPLNSGKVQEKSVNWSKKGRKFNKVAL